MRFINKNNGKSLYSKARSLVMIREVLYLHKELCEPLRITYSLDEEAYLDFNVYHIKNSKTAKKSMTIQRFLGPVLFLIVPFIFADLINVSLVGLFITFFAISIFWVMVYPAYYLRLVRNGVRKMIKEGKNDGAFGERTLFFNEEGIHETGPAGESKVYWRGIEGMGEDETNFYLYVSAVSAFIIPKRNLEDSQGIKRFLEEKIVLEQTKAAAPL